MTFECSQEQLHLLRELSQVIGDAHLTEDQKVDAFKKLFTLYYSIKEKSKRPSHEASTPSVEIVDDFVFKLRSNFEHFSKLIGDFAKNVTNLHDSIDQNEIDSSFKMPLYGQLYDSFNSFVQEVFQI